MEALANQKHFLALILSRAIMKLMLIGTKSSNCLNLCFYICVLKKFPPIGNLRWVENFFLKAYDIKTLIVHNSSSAWYGFVHLYIFEKRLGAQVLSLLNSDLAGHFPKALWKSTKLWVRDSMILSKALGSK